MHIKTPQQVDLLYALFLGRLPENNFIRQENLDRPVLDLVNAMIISDEFRQSIIERFLSYGTLPHKALPLRLLPEALALMAAAGLVRPIEGPAEVDWKSALARLLTQSPCRDMIEAACGDDARKLIEKLADGTVVPVPRQDGARKAVTEPDIVWGAEIVAQTLCRGWLIDRSHPDAPLHVRIRINGGTVKTVLADEFRRDVQDRHGGHGNCGFTIRFDLLPGISQLSHAMIEIAELSSGTVLLPDYVVELSAAPSVSLEIRLLNEIEHVRQALDRLTVRLAELSRSGPNLLSTFFRPLSARIATQETLELQKSVDDIGGRLDTITKDFPTYIRRKSWPLPLYGTIRSSINMIIEPPAPQNFCTFSVIILAVTAISVDEPMRTISSVLNQILQPTEIFVLTSEKMRLDSASFSDVGVTVVPIIQDKTTAAMTNNIASRATGSYLLIIDSGDSLMPEALAWTAATAQHTRAPIIYSDYEILDKSGEDSKDIRPIFLPAFDYDLLLQKNYIGTTYFIDRKKFSALGAFSENVMLDPHHDLLLRAAASFGEAGLVHLPLTLLSRHAVDVGGQEEFRTSLQLTIETVQQHLDMTSRKAKVSEHTDAVGRAVPGAVRVHWTSGNSADRISVIIPTLDRADLVFALLSSLKRQTALADGLEIIIVVGIDRNPQIDITFSEISRIFNNCRISFNKEAEFNWGSINNKAVRELSSGEIIVFLNDDMICLTDDWDNRIRGQLAREQVGVVGGRLLYPSGSIQHAGIAFCGDGATAHEAMGDATDHGLYLDRTLLVHQTGAVTGAFLACRRSLFDQLGGFDAERYAITASDADFCVRTRIRAKKTVIYDPSLTWIHYESASRGVDSQNYRKQLRSEAEQERWAARFSERELIDRSLNPHLTYSSRPFETFHRITHADLSQWLDVQLIRCNDADLMIDL